jgi:hypothetical protein
MIVNRSGTWKTNMTERVAGSAFSSRWIRRRKNNKPYEIFSYAGTEYIKGSPAHVIAVTKSGKEVEMRLFSSTKVGLEFYKTPR